MLVGKEAQLFVSRLLSVLGSDEAARQQVAKGWSKVPLHMLLPWSAQMLSLLEGPQGEALLPLLQVNPLLCTICLVASPVPCFCFLLFVAWRPLIFC